MEVGRWSCREAVTGNGNQRGDGSGLGWKGWVCGVTVKVGLKVLCAGRLL